MYECVFARVHVCAREGPMLMSNLESPLVAFHLTHWDKGLSIESLIQDCLVNQLAPGTPCLYLP